MRFAEMLTRSLNLVRCWLLGWCGLLDNGMLDCFLNPGRCPPYRSYCRLLFAVPRVWYCLRSRVWFWIGRSGDRGLSLSILECDRVLLTSGTIFLNRQDACSTKVQFYCGVGF